MATIIDFSPAATEIDDLASSGIGIFGLDQLPWATTQTSNILTDRAASLKFSRNAPDMLFCAEYAPNGVLLGVVVAWENYYSATHYEVFKRDKLSALSEWKRILMLSSADLVKESLLFAPYITTTLGIGIKIPQHAYCIMDGDVTIDRIYEYKVIATVYPGPQNVAVPVQNFHYDIIMSSHDLLRVISFDPSDTLGSAAVRAFGTEDYAWVLSLLNENLFFFGDAAFKRTLGEVLKGKPSSTLRVPKDFDDIVKIFIESVHEYGLRQSIFNILSHLYPVGENAGFFQSVNASFDATTNTFSFRSLSTRLAAQYAAYNKLISITDAKALPKEITLFEYDDMNDFNDFANLHLFVVRLNTIFLNVMYANNLPAMVRSRTR